MEVVTLSPIHPPRWYEEVEPLRFLLHIYVETLSPSNSPLSEIIFCLYNSGLTARPLSSRSTSLLAASNPLHEPLKKL